MFGKATLDIPASGDIGHTRHVGLSDHLAMISGRIAARTLSEGDGYVVVNLSDDSFRTLFYDSTLDQVVIGTLSGNPTRSL